MAVELQCGECGEPHAPWPLDAGVMPRTMDELGPYLEGGAIGQFRADHVGHRLSLTLYEVRVCTRCGHPACARCRHWCDRFVPASDPDEAEPCCGLECTYDESLDEDVVLTAVI